MKRETVLLHGGACAGMQVLWQAWEELRMVKCLDGHAPWPRNADNPALEYEIYRPSLDSPTVFVWVPRGTVAIAENAASTPLGSGHPYR